MYPVDLLKVGFYHPMNTDYALNICRPVYKSSILHRAEFIQASQTQSLQSLKLREPPLFGVGFQA